MTYDFVIVGAGIVGLSTAHKLSLAFPDLDILVVEKEDEIASHQTGNNSGVIHSGIYYKPNSYRAKNCVEGRHQLVDFCKEYDVDYEICGKVIVATEEDEIPRLDKIYETGQINEIEGIAKVDADELTEIEPFANGLEAIHVPCSGIVDFVGVCHQLRRLVENKGNTVACGQEVKKINSNGTDLSITTQKDTLKSRYLINCAGLYSDHVARSAGVRPEIKIVPFRGEYFELTPEAKHFVNGLIYPTPNPAFPFLGVHFTKMVSGAVECGPNAVFAFKREGYKKLSFNFNETIETLNYSGFRNLAKKHWRMGLEEWYRSLSKSAFVKDLQKLLPSIRSKHLKPSPSGVRAMALKPNGEILDDFYFETKGNQIHVLNAPSPAATAGLAIGDEIVNRAQSTFMSG